MAFHSFVAQLEVERLRIEEAFVAVRRRQLVLAQFGSAAEVVESLRSAARPDYHVKAALTAALLAEAGAGATAVRAVLVEAYLPMLAGLRRQALKETPLPPEEVEQRALEAFLGAVSAFPGSEAEPRPCLYLHRETVRRLELTLRQELRDLQRLVPVEVEDLKRGGAGCWDRPRRARHALRHRAELREDADELVALVRRHAGGAVSPRKLALVEETLLCGVELRDYVERKYPRLSAAARQRTYKRLQRERARTVEALRVALSGWRADYLDREAA